MKRFISLKRAARLVGLTGLLSFAAACSASPGATPTRVPTAPTSAPTPTAAPTATLAPIPTLAESTARPLRMGTLEAGTYHTNFLDPQLTFTLPEGWQAYFPDDAKGAALGGPGADMNIIRPTEVVDPASGSATDAPDDLVAWLQAHPRLEAAEPVATTVSGMEAAIIDVAPPEAKVDLFYDPLGNMRIPAGAAVRMIVVPLDGPDLVLFIGGKTAGASRDVAIEATQPIVDSLVIAP